MDGEPYIANQWLDFSPTVDEQDLVRISEREILEGATTATTSHASMPVRNLFLVADAGLGKSVTMRRLEYLFNLPRRPTIAFFLTPEVLTEASSDVALFNQLLALFEQRAPGLSRNPRALLERLRDAQRMVLLVDALDHLDFTQRKHLAERVETNAWQRCRWILAGRKYAVLDLIERRTGFKHTTRDWNAVWVREFTKAQQREYLGKLGDKDRYDLVQPNARAILGVPRILEYIRKLDDEEAIRRLRTASDVFIGSLRHQITQAIEKSAAARAMSGKDRFRRAMHMLGATAFCMTRTPSPEKSGEPNFIKISNDDLNPFLDDHVYPRYRPEPGRTASADWDALVAMSIAWKNCLFEAGEIGVREIQFRDRSLQEFCAAYYLAQHAFNPQEKPANADADLATLNLWYYRPEDLASEAYREIWRYLAEMPGDREDLNRTNDQSWLTAVSPMYEPSVRKDDGTWTVPRRSSEMIFRSWPRLTALCDNGNQRAIELREGWWGEFEREILSGSQGKVRQQAALALQQSFLTIPGTNDPGGDPNFRMGSPPEHNVRPDWFIKQCQDWVDQAPSVPEAEFVEHVQETWRSWGGGWRNETNEDREWIEDKVNMFREARDNKGADWLAEQTWPNNEIPASRRQSIATFALSRSPVINAWYRLYAPSHGIEDSWYRDKYERYSGSPAQPAISVSWYDAWAFAMWCRWDGRSCRLPWENEWEYAAKFQTPWDRRYWWGAEYDEAEARRHANFGGGPGKTTILTRDHSSPRTIALDEEQRRGLMDMLGNVWEWQQDRYREVYERHPEDAYGDAHTLRVLRGGSWNNYVHYLRSAVRSRVIPGDHDYDSGLRLART